MVLKILKKKTLKEPSNLTPEHIPCVSVTQSCLTLCNPRDCSTPGLAVPHHPPEFAQVHVHCVGDNTQTAYLLTPSSALNLSQHQGLCQ